MDDNYFLEIAILQAKKAYSNDEVPIGACIIKDGKVIAKAYNKKEKQNIATKHAEIIAIEKACKKLKTWHLENCILYTTLEPCMMCSGAIQQARIKKIVYGTNNINNSGLQYIPNIEVININDFQCSQMLKDFFKNKRK